MALSGCSPDIPRNLHCARRRSRGTSVCMEWTESSASPGTSFTPKEHWSCWPDCPGIRLTGRLCSSILFFTIAICFTFNNAHAVSGTTVHSQAIPPNSVQQESTLPHRPGLVRYAQAKPKKYQWLFREPRPDQAPAPVTKSTGLEQLDREIKRARKMYLSGDTDNAVLKYRSTIDHFESMLNDTPPGHEMLKEIETRIPIYDELATKILGPLHLEPKENVVGQVFHLMEKRRICRRNLTLKKAGIVRFADVPQRLLQEEAAILRKLLQIRSELPTAELRRNESQLKSKLEQVRKNLQKSSERFTLLRHGVSPSLDEVQHHVLRDDEVLLDFSLLQGRLVIGVITKAKAVYHQVPAERKDIDTAVFNLQDKLREFTFGERSTFMGHAWKEPCRRIYRALLGQLPPLPKDKPSVLVIPDRSLWYLPMSVMLDAEDRPFGADRLISFIPSADMLQFARTSGPSYSRTVFGTDLLVFESIPWVPEEQIREGKSEPPPDEEISEGEKIERLIITNPVYDKPSEIVIALQRMFKKFDVSVGPAATVDRLLAYTKRSAQLSLLAVPFAMTDLVRTDRQPCFFFSPDKQGRRRFEAGRLFSHPLETKLMILPISWFDVVDREDPLGEGPILLTTALFYSGVRMGLINYSDPNWGTDDPFLISVLKRISDKLPIRKALAGFTRDLPSGLDSSFSGKPPSWTGWILLGDPGKQ
jgi:hypothetical protein